MINKQQAVKFIVTHTPCLTLAVAGGILAPNLLSGAIHNLWIEIPLTLAGVLVGDFIGHRFFGNKEDKQSIKKYFSDLTKPSHYVKTATYFGLSLALHLLVFSSAHFGHEHLHSNPSRPNFGEHMPWFEK